MTGPVLQAAAAAFVYMTAVFLAAQVKRNNAIVDVAWGPGFLVVIAALFAARPGLHPARLLYAGLVLVWALRLAIHIGRRNAGKPEDFRYAAMRRKWGRRAALKAFFFIFMLQGVLLLVVSFSATVLFAGPARPLGPWDLAGGLTFAAGYFFEPVPDAQLPAHVRHQVIVASAAKDGPHFMFNGIGFKHNAGVISQPAHHADIKAEVIIQTVIRQPQRQLGRGRQRRSFRAKKRTRLLQII